MVLGAPLAAVACKRLPFSSVPGEIRGASINVGHRLRNANLEQSSGPPKRVPILIVGAGASGLSAAWRLDGLGEGRYELLDLEPHLGGTACFGEDGVVPYPWGAHYLPLPGADNTPLLRLLDEMGVLERNAEGAVIPKETSLVREPDERLFIDGEWHSGLFPSAGASDEDRAQLARFEKEVDRWVRWRDPQGRRAFAIPLSLCSDAAEVTVLDRQSAASWLDQRGLLSPRLRWYVEYACRDDYGATLEQTSAWAMLFYFCARRREPGQDSAFITWPEGNGRIIRHLAAKVGSRAHAGCLVTDLLPGEKSVQVAAYRVATGKLERYEAEHVILAVPRFIARRIVRPWRDQPHAATVESPWLVANLHLRQRPRSKGVVMAWDNVIYDSPSLGYVVATHQTLADRGPTVWTYYLPLVGDDVKLERERLAAMDHETAAAAVLADLSRAHDGLEAVLERLDVWRWGHAMVRPGPGFIWSAARRKAAEPLGRIHFAHTDLSGVALFEEAQDHGIRAAEAVMRARGREVRPLTG